VIEDNHTISFPFNIHHLVPRDPTGDTRLDGIPAHTELCLPKILGEQTATISGTSTTIRVVVANPDVATCPPGTVKADVTSNKENVRFTTVCVTLARAIDQWQ